MQLIHKGRFFVLKHQERGIFMLDIEKVYIKHVLENLYRNDLITFDEWMSAVNEFNEKNCSTKPTIDLL